MFKLLFNEIRAFSKFYVCLRQGNVAKASFYYTEYKKYSDAAEAITQEKLKEARAILAIQTETIAQMKQDLG